MRFEPHLLTYLEETLPLNNVIKNCQGIQKKRAKPEEDSERAISLIMSIQEQTNSLMNIVEEMRHNQSGNEVIDGS